MTVRGMTAAHARLMLEALRDWYGTQGNPEGAALVGRALARLPDVRPLHRRQAREDLEACGVLMRGGFLPIWGRALAYRVGAALHSGAPLPELPRGAR